MTALARLARIPPVTDERAAVLRPLRPLPSWAPLLSLLLHAVALGAVLVLLERNQAPDAPPEQGVEVVWDPSQESELVTGAPSPAQPPSVEAPPEPEAAREPPPPPAPTAPPPAPPPPQAMQAPPEIAPPPPAPQPVPPAELAPTLAMQLPPPPPEAAQPVILPPPPPPATEAAPEAAAELPLPPPMPPPAPRPEPARQAPARQQAAPPPAAAQPGPTAAPQAPVPPGGSQVTGRVTPPGLLSGVRNAEPEYPFASRQRGEQGVVGVVIRVAEDGSVLAVEVAQSSGHPVLDDSARRAVLRWKLKPATRDGVPIPGSIRTAIHFSLR